MANVNAYRKKFGTPEYPPEFWDYLEDNWHIFVAFVKEARRARKAGIERTGAFMLINWLRWETQFKEENTRYKISNDYAPYLARLAMARFPELEGLFETKTSKKQEARCASTD
jgi:hypothetical protein